MREGYPSERPEFKSWFQLLAASNLLCLSMQLHLHCLLAAGEAEKLCRTLGHVGACFLVPVAKGLM